MSRLVVPAVVLSLAGVLLGAAPAEAVSSVQFGRVYYNSPGTDTSLNAEWAIVKNVSGSTRCLTGWTVRDVAGRVYTFGSFCLGPSKHVYRHTGSGTNSASHRYWSSGNDIWNNTGDMDRCRWGSSGSCTYC